MTRSFDSSRDRISQGSDVIDTNQFPQFAVLQDFSWTMKAVRSHDLTPTCNGFDQYARQSFVTRRQNE